MPTKRIVRPGVDPERGPCRHPEHDPPKHRVFEPGTWEHECPKCWHKTVFTVREPPSLGTPRSLLETGGSVLPDGMVTRTRVTVR